jgi:hypothetical protein
MVNWFSLKICIPSIATVLIFFIAGLRFARRQDRSSVGRERPLPRNKRIHGNGTIFNTQPENAESAKATAHHNSLTFAVRRQKVVYWGGL